MAISFRELLGFIDDEDFQTFVQTTENASTVTSKTHRVPRERRVDLTSQVEELEFLAASTNVHPDALVSKLVEARRALRGSANWTGANYADPRSRWDDSRELGKRLDDAQRAIEARLGYRISLR